MLDAPQPMQPLEGSTNGIYELYLVDREGKRRVLKCLAAKYRNNPAFIALLRKEFDIAYNLSSPYICEVYSFTEHIELGWSIEMEWIDGIPLDKYLATYSLPAGRKRRLLNQLLDAVGYIHSKQVVHKDLKPSNILVTHNGENIKIIDFGFADNDAYSILKLSAGTREYAAPELIAGKPVDNRADIWSLGKLLPLFGGWRRVVRQCLQEDPQERYGSVEEIRKAIAAPGRVRIWIPAAVLLLAALLSLSLIVPQKPVADEVLAVVAEVEDVPVRHLWQKGDRFYISDKTNRPVYETTADGVAKATFRYVSTNKVSLSRDSSFFWAFYPVSILSKLPDTQEYAADGPSLVPMVGYYHYKHSGPFKPRFTFKSVCGVIKLNLTAEQPGIQVCKILLHADKGLSGRYRVNKELSFIFKGTGDLALTCPDVPVGSDPVPFYVSVPPENYHELTVTVYSSDGRVLVWTLPASQVLTVDRARVTSLDVIL